MGIYSLPQVCSVTRSASARHWVGDGFNSWPKLLAKDVKVVPTAAMSDTRHL